MWLRKNKSSSEQGSGRGRRYQRSGGPSPAFSYYTNNRGSDTGRGAPTPRHEQVPAGASGRVRLGARFGGAQLPFWLLLALTAICLLKVLFLSTSPKVTVVGGSSNAPAYLQSTDVYAAAAHKLLTSSITSRSKLTVDLGGTASKLEREFPELQAVSMGVPLISSRPIVYVQVAQPSLVLQMAHGNYVLNKSGVVLAKVRALPAGVPTVSDQSGVTPRPGKQFLPSSTVSFVQTVAYQFAAAHLTISTFTLPTAKPYEVEVRLSGQQYYMRFNLQADARLQSGAAIAVTQQLGGSVPEYIDVRVPGRAYYK